MTNVVLDQRTGTNIRGRWQRRKWQRTVSFERRNRAQQAARVRMSRSVKNLLAAALLQQPSMPHHSHAIRHFSNHGEIVRDEQHGQPKLLLQIAQQLQYL